MREQNYIVMGTFYQIVNFYNRQLKIQIYFL